MAFKLRNGKTVIVKPYNEGDLVFIQNLNKEEKWLNLVKNGQETKNAWKHSNVTYVVYDDEKLVAYIRGLTDQFVTLFVCELLVQKDYRGYGLGQKLLQYVHDLYPNTRIEMLASSTSRTFYEQLGYRPFYGYRKTYGE
ncbi:Acetyltransferase (GNAT) domain-containing protein [Salinibacillus kushneri]|uniref:Acetyltransferase (GNAT) domain-containing protein n=1 Tax=Salinibacillus kushneri TaxID=237682 RepID=A0A1I0F6W6_9BACI|nr:GNAT family N-acetyltransferase [Salinibacillus kushneri]SET53580.1 Acetyltransferase (GNAT) domain-containing protein [Salinibacillus kushneri]